MFKKVLLSLVVLCVTAGSTAFLAAGSAPLAAQTDYDYDFDYDYDYTTTTVDEDAAVLGTLFAGGMLIFMLGILFVLYLYMGFAMMTIAKKVGEPNGWLAFIPIANLYLFVKLAGLPGAYALIFLVAIIPVLGGLAVMVFYIYLWVKIAERRGFPNWYGVLIIVPLVNLILPGYIAWGNPPQTQMSAPKTEGSTEPMAPASTTKNEE